MEKQTLVHSCNENSPEITFITNKKKLDLNAAKGWGYNKTLEWRTILLYFVFNTLQ